MDQSQIPQLPPMPPEWKTVMYGAVLAMFGGVLRALKTPNCSVKGVLLEAGTSIFAALILGPVLLNFGAPLPIIFASCGLCGWGSNFVLDKLFNKYCGTIGSDANPKEEPK